MRRPLLLRRQRQARPTQQQRPRRSPSSAMGRRIRMRAAMRRCDPLICTHIMRGCLIESFISCTLQYYHTVTAVRRNDAQKSPMTKVMDLFRHRSNSAVSEADKRKAVSILAHRNGVSIKRDCSRLHCSRSKTSAHHVMRLFVNWTIVHTPAGPCTTPKQPFDCCINNTTTTHTHLQRAHRSAASRRQICMGNAAARERDEMRFHQLFLYSHIYVRELSRVAALGHTLA